MREHSLKWKCTSKSHELFLTQSRGDYLQHMKHHHSGRFSQAQLDVLADRNGARMTGPMFPSCPLCGISKESLEGGSIESHLTGHLRLLALKSLPAYEESVGEDDDSDQNSVATSRPETRSTIRNYNNDGNDEVDGNRNWKAQDIRKLRSPNSDKNVKVFVEQHLQAADSSSFIDEGIFDGVPIHERRCFEWPLLAPSSFDSKPDPMLVSFIARWDRENRGSHGSWDGSMDPDCAICLRRASERCLCEAEALDMMIRQAEDRIFAPTRRELLRWVRKKSQDHVLRGFDSYWQDGHLHNQFEEHSSKQKQAPTTDTRLDSEQKLREQQERGKPPTEEPEPTSLPPAPTKGEVDDTWCTAYQSYPETLEYYFALAKVSLPESDDPAILDPPLAKWTLPPHDSYAELPTRPVSARREGQ